jgi:hypothetical protein
LPCDVAIVWARVRECLPTKPPVLIDLDDLDLATHEA